MIGSACTEREKTGARGAFFSTSVALMTGRGSGEDRRTGFVQLLRALRRRVPPGFMT
ncbi:hypothetical protein LY78DRAFT_656408 [Colletotrichum sublineola]|nr:hypothetical protein LY78DRAFT_656408 [Colletotrichum sublineola]